MRLKKVLHELQEEKEMNKSLLTNQDEWKKRVQILETEMRQFHSSKDKVCPPSIYMYEKLCFHLHGYLEACIVV